MRWGWQADDLNCSQLCEVCLVWGKVKYIVLTGHGSLSQKQIIRSLIEKFVKFASLYPNKDQKFQYLLIAHKTLLSVTSPKTFSTLDFKPPKHWFWAVFSRYHFKSLYGVGGFQIMTADDGGRGGGVCRR